MQRWMMMITSQEWRIVIVYLNIRMTRGNGDTEREPSGDAGRDTLSCHTIVPPQPEYSTQGGPLHNGTPTSTNNGPTWTVVPNTKHLQPFSPNNIHFIKLL